jgi:hypothetical protein
MAKLWSLEASGQGVKIIEEINHISLGMRFQGNAAQAGASIGLLLPLIGRWAAVPP